MEDPRGRSKLNKESKKSIGGKNKKSEKTSARGDS